MGGGIYHILDRGNGRMSDYNGQTNWDWSTLSTHLAGRKSRQTCKNMDVNFSRS